MYWLIRILHILAVVALLGNLLMAPFWRRRLAILGGPQARAAANRSVRVADLMFTLPGWVVVLVTGILLSIARQWKGGWLHVSLLLFLVWIVLWHLMVMRPRNAMIAQAEEVASSPQMPMERVTELGENERKWQLWSHVSAALVALILIFMVLLSHEW